MNDQNIIAQFIVNTVEQNPGIMGCRLGKVVKDTFPGFRGLRGFIALNCATKVTIVARKGEDFAYDLVSRGAAGESPATYFPAPTPAAPANASLPKFSAVDPPYLKPAIPVRPSDIRATFWQAFTNPNSNIRLVINKATTEMSVGAFPTIEPPFAEIKKVTRDEHEKVMRGFLDLLDPADRQYVQQAVGPNLTWSRWSAFMWNFGAGKYSSLWLNYRTSMLRKLFEDRLVALDFDSDVIPVLVAKLMDSKRDIRTSGKLHEANSLANIKTPSPLANQSLSEDYMRKLAGIVVSHMDIDELRSLRLPLGAVVDALEKNAPRP